MIIDYVVICSVLIDSLKEYMKTSSGSSAISVFSGQHSPAPVCIIHYFIIMCLN